jgi:hypothetical protein
MKKNVKKLTLAKETLRMLEPDLIAVQGGAITDNYTDCYPYRCPNMPASARC